MYTLTTQQRLTLGPASLSPNSFILRRSVKSSGGVASTSFTPLFGRQHRGNTLAWCLAAADTKQHVLLTWLWPLYTDAPPHTTDSILYTLGACYTGCSIVYYTWFSSAIYVGEDDLGGKYHLHGRVKFTWDWKLLREEIKTSEITQMTMLIWMGLKLAHEGTRFIRRRAGNDQKTPREKPQKYMFG